MKLPSVRSFEDRKPECLSLDNSMHTTLEGTNDIATECVRKSFIEAQIKGQAAQIVVLQYTSSGED